MSDVVKCPKCGTEVPITESLAAPMIAAVRAEYEERLTRSREAGEQLNQRVKAQEVDLERKRASLETTITERVSQIRVEERDAAQREAAEQVRALNTKLGEAQQAQAAAVRKERELESRERAVQLTIEQGITQGVTAARQEARREADEAARLRLLEKETLLESMQKKIDELQQKAIQGSQQLQGEVQELELEATLRARFPFDTIVEVGKGVNGADVTQEVMSPSGARCGVILWESKRTKNWSASWLPKLREDGRRASADLLVIASAALPPDMSGFDQVDGVWVCEPKHAVPLAALLREALLRAHAVRQAQAGQATKAELVYQYLTGPAFRHRVEALVEAFTTMTEDLTTERRAVTKSWAKREAQLDKVLASTTGLFGDLQGISGAAIQEIEGLAMKTLGGGDDQR